MQSLRNQLHNLPPVEVPENLHEGILQEVHLERRRAGEFTSWLVSLSSILLFLAISYEVFRALAINAATLSAGAILATTSVTSVGGVFGISLILWIGRWLLSLRSRSLPTVETPLPASVATTAETIDRRSS